MPLSWGPACPILQMDHLHPAVIDRLPARFPNLDIMFQAIHLGRRKSDVEIRHFKLPPFSKIKKVTAAHDRQTGPTVIELAEIHE